MKRTITVLSMISILLVLAVIPVQAAPTSGYGVAQADRGIVTAGQSYVWRYSPDWKGWTKLYTGPNTWGTFLGLDNWESQNEYSQFGLAFDTPSALAWGNGVTHDNVDIVDVGPIDICNPNGGPNACVTTAGETYNANAHALMLDKGIHMHDITGDGAITCGSDDPYGGDDPYCHPIWKNGTNDGIYVADMFGFAQSMFNRAGSGTVYLIGSEFGYMPISPRVAANDLFFVAAQIRDADSTAKVYFGDFGGIWDAYDCTGGGAVICPLIEDFDGNGIKSATDYWRTVAKRWREIANGNTSYRPDGFWNDGGMAAHDILYAWRHGNNPKTSWNPIEPGMADWGKQSWNDFSLFVDNNVKMTSDFLGQFASDWYHSANHTYTEWGAGGDSIWYMPSGYTCADIPNPYGGTVQDEGAITWSGWPSGYHRCDYNNDPYNQGNESHGRYWSNASFDIIMYMGTNDPYSWIDSDSNSNCKQYPSQCQGSDIARRDNQWSSALSQQILLKWAAGSGNWVNNYMGGDWFYRRFYSALDGEDGEPAGPVPYCQDMEYAFMDADYNANVRRAPTGITYEQAVINQNYTYWPSGTWWTSTEDASGGAYDSCIASGAWPIRPTSQLPPGW